MHVFFLGGGLAASMVPHMFILPYIHCCSCAFLVFRKTIVRKDLEIFAQILTAEHVLTFEDAVESFAELHDLGGCSVVCMLQLTSYFNQLWLECFAAEVHWQKNWAQRLSSCTRT